MIELTRERVKQITREYVISHGFPLNVSSSAILDSFVPYHNRSRADWMRPPGFTMIYRYISQTLIHELGYHQTTEGSRWFIRESVESVAPAITSLTKPLIYDRTSGYQSGSVVTAMG